MPQQTDDIHRTVIREPNHKHTTGDYTALSGVNLVLNISYMGKFTKEPEHYIKINSLLLSSSC
jgi:hypothetical protein